MPSRESIIVYKSVLSVFTQEFSLVVWLHVRPENEPKKKLVRADIFGSFGPTKKKIMRSSATHALVDMVVWSTSSKIFVCEVK